MLSRVLALVLCASSVGTAVAKECWVLSSLKGLSAASVDKWSFSSDGFSNPMVLCFNDDGTGSVAGDDTPLTRFGTSTLVGFVKNEGIELSESYQIVRKAGTVLFIKSRIGTATVLPGAPDIVGAFVGKAVRIPR